MEKFFSVLLEYILEILPALAGGFFLSGLIHEFIPGAWVEKKLGAEGFMSVVYASAAGTILPICCWGTLPIAVSFRRKGSRLGPVLAFLVATPATSVSALLVSYKLLGAKFVLFEFFAVILMGLTIGLIGNRLSPAREKPAPPPCSLCDDDSPHIHNFRFFERMRSALKFAFYELPKDIGLEIFIGIVLAAIVVTAVPVGQWIKQNLGDFRGYVFALVFSLIMYICSTATVPLVEAFLRQGLSSGAGMVVLLAGPVTSYGTIFVLKKEFGIKLLVIYLLFISVGSLLLGYLFSLL
jgi:uncharacterized protein